MAFQMKDSPHKRGEIQGTESALKVKSWIMKQITKNAPKVINKIDDAWVATRDAIFGGSKKTVKGSKYHKLHADRNTVDFMSDRTARGGQVTGNFGVKLDDAGNWAFDPTKKMSGSPEDVKKIDEIVNFMNWKKNLK